MTLEELKEQKRLLKNRIEYALRQFYDATDSIGCNVYGSFDTEWKRVAIKYDYPDKRERFPKVIIKPIEL